MNAGIRTVIYPVKDLAQAKALYGTLLGVEPYVDEPYYVGFRLEDQEFGLDPSGHDQGMRAGRSPTTTSMISRAPSGSSSKAAPPSRARSGTSEAAS